MSEDVRPPGAMNPAEILIHDVGDDVVAVPAARQMSSKPGLFIIMTISQR